MEEAPFRYRITKNVTRWRNAESSTSKADEQQNSDEHCSLVIGLKVEVVAAHSL